LAFAILQKDMIEIPPMGFAKMAKITNEMME
jgi:hypothetical protein